MIKMENRNRGGKVSKPFLNLKIENIVDKNIIGLYNIICAVFI